MIFLQHSHTIEAACCPIEKPLGRLCIEGNSIPLSIMQAKRKRNNMAGLKIVVAGCVAAQEGETLLRRVPELDLVLGPHHANRCALLRFGTTHT